VRHGAILVLLLLAGFSADNACPAILFQDSFSDGNTNSWTVRDDSGKPSNWQVVNGVYQQDNDVGGRSSYKGTYHLGTYAYLSAGLPWTDYRFRVALRPRPDVKTDIGVMFRYQNNDNYYRLSFNSAHGFTRLERKFRGSFSTLAVNAKGYDGNELLTIVIEAKGNLILVYLNDVPLFRVSDARLTSGTVALYCQDKTLFDDIVVTDNGTAPSIVLSEPLSVSVTTTDAVETLGFNPAIGVPEDYFITIGDSITLGVDDNYSADNRSLNKRVLALQGYQANLVDLLTAKFVYLINRMRASPRRSLVDLLTARFSSIVIFNEGIGGDKSFDTLTYRLNSILERHRGSNKALILLGTNDSHGTMPIPSGLGCVGTGCDGTFKQNVQALVDRLIAAGKTRLMVAKVPPAFGSRSDSRPFADPLSTSRNQLIQQYNAVIASELTHIEQGPDFFSFFLSPAVNRFSLFADNLHPNALGTAIMARLWYNALTGARTQPFVLDDLAPTKFKQNLLEVGDVYRTDRPYILTSVPTVLKRGIWVMAPEADAVNTSDQYLSFTINHRASVYVAYDSRATALPHWLRSFTDTGLTVGVSEPETPLLRLYRLDNLTGPITLGGNQAAGASGALTNYIAVVVR
jgi:lysophospholipase L1-like esterase